MTQYLVIIFLIFLCIVFIAIYGRSVIRSIIAGRDIIKNLKNSPRSKSEAEVIRLLEELTGAKFPTVRPDWLNWHGKNLELDGYNEKLKLGIEFSGPLHTKWTPSFEPYEQYLERIERDEFKKKQCGAKGVNLIVIHYSLPSRHWRTYIKSRLFDFGMIEFKPTDYIAEQVVVPYRNEYFEKNVKC